MSVVVYFVIGVLALSLALNQWGARRERQQFIDAINDKDERLHEVTRSMVRSALARNGIEFERAEQAPRLADAQIARLRDQRGPEPEHGPPQEGFG